MDTAFLDALGLSDDVRAPVEDGVLEELGLGAGLDVADAQLDDGVLEELGLGAGFDVAGDRIEDGVLEELGLGAGLDVAECFQNTVVNLRI